MQKFILIPIIISSVLAGLIYFVFTPRGFKEEKNEANSAVQNSIANPLLNVTEPPKPIATSSDNSDQPIQKKEMVKEPENKIISEESKKILENCQGFSLNERFKCFRDYYRAIIQESGIKAAMDDLRAGYADPFVKAQCHQLTHIIGREAADKYKDPALAFARGDSFCWSGYYHGVMEKITADVGRANIASKISSICANIPGKAGYSFDYYNCVHGLGHGVMAMTNNELPESLKLCDNIEGQWEKSSCWSGAFMENVIADEVFHTSKYLKNDDPHYPCDIVDDKYKGTCYLMQTSRMLALVGYDFKKVFDLCKNAGESYIDTCYQSLGRDASGKSISNLTQTRATCLLGEDYRQKSNCVVGAVKDFISYFHSDKEAKELCVSLPQDLQNICYSIAASYYRVF